MAKNNNVRTKAATESLLGSLGILIVGFITIPTAAHVVGAEMTLMQGASMSFLFFFGRWFYLFALRMWFSKREAE